jgi:hypothetical protein
MAVTDRTGLPIAVGIASASPHEVTLVEETLDQGFLSEAPERLIGDCAYDSDALDRRLWDERRIELIAPHRRNRKHITQDGPPFAATSGAGRWSGSSPGSTTTVA